MHREVQKLSHWQFVCRDDGTEAWSWRRAGSDGGIEAASEPMPNYGQAVVDAINHGFQPKSDSWTVHLARGSLHYPPRRGARDEVYLGSRSRASDQAGAPYRRRQVDPKKRVSAVAVGVESDEIRVMFIIDGEQYIITERPGLTREQAELIAAGIANGLRAAALGYFLDEPERPRQA